LKKTHKVGVGSFVLRSKESLCIIKPQEKLLVINKIRFAEEIRIPDNLNLPVSNNSAAEMKMATQLINQLTKEFDISKFKDTYTGKLLKIIKEKSRGKSIPMPALRIVHSKSSDLMNQLKASISGSHSRKKAS